MEIVSSIMFNNPCYRDDMEIEVKGLMLHSVGVPQPNANVFVDSWNKKDFNNACVHAFIDGVTGLVYQTLPWNHRGWHSGGASNNTHIGIEMCEPSEINYVSGSNFTCLDLINAKKIAGRTYVTAIQLFAFLCDKYNLDPLKDGVIISHREGYTRGLATNHGDPEHLWDGLKMGYSMDSFRKAVNKQMNTKNDPIAGSFVVKVSIQDLIIRKGPGTNFDKTGKFTGVGSFTIIETRSGVGSKNGWGRLKSDAGWISLDYCMRI